MIVANAPRRVFLDTNPTTVRKRLGTQKLVENVLLSKGFAGTIPVNITRYYTDVDGVVIPKATAPAALQVSVPVYALGEFDRQGGFRVGQQSVVPAAALQWLQTFVYGAALPFPFATTLSTIQNYLNSGDVIQVWTDDVTSPNYYIFIVLSIKTPGQANIASIMSNLRSGALYCDSFDYYALTNNNVYQPQFNEPLRFVRFSNAGQYVSDDINPLSFKDPLTQQQNNFIAVMLEFSLSHFLGIYFYLEYGTDSVQLNFKIRTV